MTTSPLPPVSDLNSIPEILCDGPCSISVIGPLATLSFTHVRSEPGPLFTTGVFTPTTIVRARIVLTFPNLIALKAQLARIIQAVETAGSAAPVAGGTATKH